MAGAEPLRGAQALLLEPVGDEGGDGGPGADETADAEAHEGAAGQGAAQGPEPQNQQAWPCLPIVRGCQENLGSAETATRPMAGPHRRGAERGGGHPPEPVPRPDRQPSHPLAPPLRACSRGRSGVCPIRDIGGLATGVETGMARYHAWRPLHTLTMPGWHVHCPPYGKVVSLRR
jgi:hypothetical protein